MNTSELRRGNYVSVRTSNVFKVDVIGKDHIEGITIESEFVNQEKYHYRSSEHDYHTEPIPLTEEWLKRLGFDNKIDDELPEDADFLVYFKDNYSVEVEPDDLGLISKYTFCIYEGIVDSDGDYASQGVWEKEVKYVHSLQNLFLSISDEELEVK